MYKAQVYNNVQ